MLKSYQHNEILIAILKHKISMLYNNHYDKLLAIEAAISYIVEKIEDVKLTMYGQKYQIFNNKESVMYSFVDMLIPCLELEDFESRLLDNDVKNLQNYYFYRAIIACNNKSGENKDCTVTDNIYSTYLLDIKNIKKLELYPAHAVIKDKNYLLLLPTPLFFNMYKSFISYTTSDKYFTELYSLEELNLCLENYVKLTNIDYSNKEIITL